MQKYFQNTAPAVIIGIAILVATVIGATTFYKIRSLDNTLSVTGSTKVRVKADLAKWTISTNSVVSPDQVSYAYSTVSNDMAKIKNFLVKNGVSAEQMTLSPIYSDDYWSGNSERKVNVRQTVTVNSGELDKIKTISENMTALSQEGVVFAPESPQYYVSSLPDLRVSLIGKAVVDAQARAKEIASSMGQSVGKLKSASSGVVQVLQPDSNDVSDYGQYDTLTIDKDVMVTVRATFLIK